jgi:hypothetical protein
MVDDDLKQSLRNELSRIASRLRGDLENRGTALNLPTKQGSALEIDLLRQALVNLLHGLEALVRKLSL